MTDRPINYEIQDSHKHMRSKKLTSAIFCSLLLASTSYAATVSGTVTNKTMDKPSAGDLVELVDVQAGMSAVAKATTDARGHYSLNEPGSGPYLVRATHQGAGYFIAAPQGAGPGDISVYDASPNASISIEDQIIDIEAQNSQLDVTEQYVVHNSSSPKVTKSGANTFEFALPDGAVIDMAEATRPSGLPTMAQPKEMAKGRFAFGVPIEPDQGDKMTVFQIHYHLPYTGKYTFKPTVTMPTDNLAVQLPKAMAFTAGAGAAYQPIPQDPSIQTYLLKNAQPGKAMEFTVSGTGSMPREQQGAGQQEAGGQGQPAGGPGGGIGEPINQPDPLTKYKWWILGGLGVLLAVVAAFLLRKPAGVPAGAAVGTAAPVPQAAAAAAPSYASHVSTSVGKNGALLAVLKDELFALESEKLSGTIDAGEYAEQKAALEVVLKRALKRTS
jgi:hypothetical protein